MWVIKYVLEDPPKLAFIPLLPQGQGFSRFPTFLH